MATMKDNAPPHGTPRLRPAPLIFGGLLLIGSWQVACADARQSGIAKRIPWTTSRTTGSSEPPLPFVSERAFPGIKFEQCLDLTTAPGIDRLFVVEQSGKIFSFPRRDDADAADLVIDFAKAIPGVQQVYSLAFHPDFKNNRYCYVCYIMAPDVEDGTHVARFRLEYRDEHTAPPTIDAASEQTILTWRSGGHNGCCLKFGPDGYLYISTGDAGPANPPDPLRSGQDISNLLSAILRVDVDHASSGNNYRIPDDNPFVHTSGARGEIWAYGLRNPWRMSFDRESGDLWVGDVGWELWEMLYRVERGGNYGWAIMEGRQPTHPEWPRGPTPILSPTIEHPHSESSSITDGLTYYGNRLKELHGMHIYSDYDTGKFWGFRFVDGQVVEHRELADTTHRVVGFGEDNDGEFYVLDHTAGTIHRLVPNPNRDQPSSFPRRLSESGLFTSVASHLPAPGVIAYSINAEPWADHAFSERLVAVPGDASINAAVEPWVYPKDTLLVKTLSLEMEPGNRRRVETQLLHFDGIDWQTYSYQWNEDQTDAVLLEASGAEQTFEIIDRHVAGGKRQQTWRFPGRAECQRCHNKWSGPPLAFNTLQLHREHRYDKSLASQLDTLAEIHLLENLMPKDKRPQLADPADSSATLDARARAYLHANCAHCHRMHAGSAVLSKMTYDLPLDKMDMVGARPTQGTFGIHAAQVVAPGDPSRSILLYRMAKLGSGRMPHIGSSEVDLAGLGLIQRWIDQIPIAAAAAADTTADDAHAARRVTVAAQIDQLTRADHPAEKTAVIDQLLTTTSGAISLLNAIDNSSFLDITVAAVVERAAQHSDASVRDLFERFLPSERRVKRLGSVVRADQILAISGDAGRGKQVFFATSGVQCKNCHRVGREGVELGPDLSNIGKKYSRGQLLETILEPSKFIEPKYLTYLLETKQGRVMTGLLVQRDADEVVLKDAKNERIRVPASDVEQLVAQQQSIMPELLLRDMTAQQVADLLEFLWSLK